MGKECHASEHSGDKALEQCYVSKEELWHQQYGHLGIDSLNKLAANVLVEEFDYGVSDIPFCEPCCKGKQHKSPFPQSGGRFTAIVCEA